MQHENLDVQDNLSMKMGKSFDFQLNIDVNMHIQLFDENGKLKDERILHNTVTTAGKNGIADQILAAPSLAKIGWCALGTGTPGATLLGAEVARVVFDSKTRSGAVITTITTFPAGTGTGAITEEGLFDVVTANTVNMWASSSFSVVNKGAADSIIVTHTITVS